ncbi:uncharacterized protein M6B38_166420 [Iris pallida]|uniref:ZCF37 n=1 Tax=Iris pallida TaxID=29817 RepID=A0AAX6EWH5_IRIPA|nr:uncharacterized protein M6B38_166420 [Iris pallida]
MICGAGSFPHEHDDEPSASAASTSKKAKQINPYSTRGLDKFSTVLAELGAKRERIMARTGSQGVALVQFVYHNSKDWVPIVVRPKPQAGTSIIDDKKPPSSTTTNKQQSKDVVPAATTTTKTATTKRRGKVIRSSSYYWPLVVVLILVCLVMFGRVFAICCTSMWWYMVPTFKDWNGEDAKKKLITKKKKEYGRKLSDKRLTAPSSQPKKA